MEFRTIRQTSHIDGSNRNPGIGEHDKAMVWDNNSQKVKYVLINGLSANSKTVDGYVAKGDDSSAANYIWKLDATKNPAWRLEEYLASITKVGNSAVFTMNSGGTKTLALGALAWQDSVIGSVTSVFGRSGDVLALSGDYTAAKVTNAFDKLNNTLDDVLVGATNKHFTAAYKAEVDANTLARHTHSNKSVLDLITNAGDGVIPTSAQIFEWDNYTTGDAQNVMDTVDAFIQDNTGITWAYDDALNTLTPTINLGAFTADNLPAGITNKYYIQPVYTFTLPAASTVASRCAGTIIRGSGTSAWTIAVDTNPIDLLITHGLNRNVVAVSVFAITTEGNRLLLNNAAYSGIISPIADPQNTIRIESLATIELPIIINVTFS
jgi:hypothetical protein